LTRWQAGTSALRSRTGLRRALNAYGIFSIAEFSIWLAILIDANRVGGAKLAGLVALLQLMPAVVLLPLLSGLSDRVSRGRGLVTVYCIVAVTTLVTGTLLLIKVPFAWVVVGAVISTTAVSFVRPMHFSALPQLAKSPSELVSANALSSVMDGIGLVVGPILAGALVQWVGSWLVFYGAAAASLIAAAMCTGLSLKPPVRRGVTSPKLGVGALFRDWAILALIVIVGAKFVVEGGLDIMGVSYSNAVLHNGTSGAGLLVGAVGFGGLVGAALGSVVSARPRLTPVVLAGGLITGIGLTTVAWLGGLGLVMTMLALVGFGATLLMVSSRTLLQRSADDAILVRVFALQEAMGLLGLALGAVIAPVLISWTSPSKAFIPMGLGMVLLTLGAIGFVRKLDSVAVYRPRELAVLRSIGFLTPLPPAELEYVANHSQWREVATGEVVVTQGERGTEYFVIETGKFSVIEDGVLKAHTINAGEGFGEKALLNGEIRTATVTALEPGHLLVIRPQEFLGAFGRSVDDLLPPDDSQTA
jgi:MFS family permease